MSSNDSTGLLLVAHGTRSETGVEEFLALARSIGERLAPLPVEQAFLELAKPDIEQAVERLLARGIKRLVTVPLLLFAAGHIKRDIPQAVASALARRGKPHIDQIQAGHLGCHPAIVELSRRRMEESVQQTLVPRLPPGNALPGGSRLQEPREDDESAAQRGRASRYCGPREDPGTETCEFPSCLLLVARGSRDNSATAEMYDYARLRAHDLVPRLPPGNALTGGSRLREPRVDDDFAAQRGRASRYGGPREDPRTENPTVPTVEVAFLAMARPLLSEELAEVAGKGYSRVIVQPHFLFDGELVESIGQQVAAMAAKHPETNWLVTAPLADRAGFVTSGTRLLQKVIFDRLEDARIHVVAPAGDD